MKRMICILLTILVCSAPVFAAEVDEYAATEGMGRSWYQGYEPVIRSNRMTIHLPLKAEGFVGDIRVSIALEDPNVYLLAAEPKEVTVSEKNGVYPVKLTLSLQKDRRSGDYPAVITIKNGEKVETLPWLIRIRDGYGSHETLEPQILEVQGALDIGSEGGLRLTIGNPTATLAMTDAELTVTDASGEVLMSGSDRFEVPDILPGKQETVTVPMTILGDASIRVHTLKVELRYRVLDAEQTWTESFTVPVTQAIRLEQGGVTMPDAIAGELADMSLPLMNMGRGELSNVLVTLEMDGVADAQSVLVGTLLPGETKQAKLTFTPGLDSVGHHTGTVTITCEDAYGNTDTQTLEVSLNIDEPLPAAEAPEQEAEKKPGAGTIALIVLSVALATALVIQSIVLTGKIHKLEEDRL